MCIKVFIFSLLLSTLCVFIIDANTAQMQAMIPSSTQKTSSSLQPILLPPTIRPPVQILIPPSSNLIEIARRLVNKGVLTNPWMFLTQAFRYGSFKPGIYKLRLNMDASSAIETLANPPIYKLTIPEGLTVAEITRYLNKQSFLMGGIFTLPLEGSLLPETYRVSYGDSRITVLKRMEDAMSKTLKEVWEKPSPTKELIGSEMGLLTLASIIEKETGRPAERPHIAGVFLNRLAKKMRLQSDPTASYAVTGGKQPLGRPITKADLAVNSPINTYVTAGIPPQPIACPGKAALIAVMEPLRTQNLYFVADGTGGHQFSETLDQHNMHVKKWRKLQKSK